MLLILLTGNPPFERSTESDPHFQLFKQQGIRGILNLYNVENLHEDAINLMEKLLTLSVNQRMTIEEIPDHLRLLDKRV